jgi:hypothetical protein
MFSRTAPDTEADPVVPQKLIPLSVLRLELPDLDTASLAGRDDVAIVLDDVGRAAIARSDAKMLIDEQRAREERQRELLAAADLAAEQYDRAWRASLGVGVPASMIPPGSTYLAAVLDAELNSAADGYRPRRSTVAEDLLSNDGAITFTRSPTGMSRDRNRSCPTADHH